MKPRKLTGMWIDGSKAVLVTIAGEESDLRTIRSGVETHERIKGEGNQAGRFGKQYVEDERSKEHRIHDQEHKFIEHLIDEVRTSDQLMVFGPAQMKTRFEKLFAADSRPKPNLRAVKAADSMTDNQIAAYVREFFGKPGGPGY